MSTATNTPGRAANGRKHLPFLDGIRGLAAVYVVAMHAIGIATDFQSPPGRSHYVLQPLLYGQIAVSVFIVLSGFCLTLPYLRRGSLQPMHRADFCRKRAWRILPPYYAALLLSVVVHRALAHGYQTPSNLSVGSSLSHLFLVHDASPSWIKAINQPMWSVAVEWHIYFVFAFALFPVWRRFGIGATLALACALGVLPHVALGRSNLDWAHPWYLLSFAIGMLAAVITETDRPSRLATLARTRNGPLLLATSAMLAALYALKARLGDHLFLVTDTLEGVIAALLIVRFEHEWRTGTRSLPRRAVEAPAALGLGAMSYSLYLFHWPLLLLVNAAVAQHVRPEPRCWVMLSLGLPLALVVSLAAYLAIERPLIRKRHRVALVPPTDLAHGSPAAVAGLLVQP